MGRRPFTAGVFDLMKGVAAEAGSGGYSQPACDALSAELQTVVGFANGFVVDVLDDIWIKVGGLD